VPPPMLPSPRCVGATLQALPLLRHYCLPLLLAALEHNRARQAPFLVSGILPASTAEQGTGCGLHIPSASRIWAAAVRALPLAPFFRSLLLLIAGRLGW
jgi:hypothetical protein